MFNKVNHFFINFLFFIRVITTAVKQNRQHHKTRGNPSWWRAFQLPWRALLFISFADWNEVSDLLIMDDEGMNIYDWDPAVGNYPINLFGFGCLQGDGTPQTNEWNWYYWCLQTPKGNVPLPMIDGTMWTSR